MTEGDRLARLLLPLAGVIGFFLLSLATVRFIRPKQPRQFFLLYTAALVVVTIVIYLWEWPLDSLENAAGLMSAVLLQTLVCLTIWNAFYSLLWGFSGGLMCDLYNDEKLRRVDLLIRSYARDDGLDRIMARRLPNLATGGYIELHDDMLKLRWKGRLIALGTRFAFKAFSLGMGGGIK
ncbi:MAG: hypothetical protein C5B57_09910 [Blastocatellia bacterium]|nr:MAG: hypothetical protein C5B57_09910 [Blastocatellia bacterium]